VCIEGRVELSLALVEPAKQHRAEVKIPDSVVDLFQADVLVDEGMTDVQPPALPADPAVSADAPDLEVAGVLDPGQHRREKARLVMLPAEPHGYRARESILNTLAEMLEWADRWVKNRPAAKTAEGSVP
jgi:hypothetical protein